MNSKRCPARGEKMENQNEKQVEKKEEKQITFKDLNLSEKMIKVIDKKGFEVPSPIQAQAIPMVLEGNFDIIARAQTGTGKTAAFGIPLLEKIDFNHKNAKVLVVTPTRELAIQVSEELNSLKPSKQISVFPIYGGTSYDKQFSNFKRGIDIIVGTPGRLLDHMNRKPSNFANVEYLVLDEADEMLSMGFIDDIKKLIQGTKAEKNIMLFSATMPKEIVDLSRRFLKDPKKIEIKSLQMTTELTKQLYFEVRREDKFEALSRIIDIEPGFYGIVFCRTKVDTDKVAQDLTNRGYDAEALHGDISQHQRERILKKFQSKRANVLCATDVAARGIDVKDLTHVINYSIPQDPESYVHRIGRTGRAGKEGTAITFVTPSEHRKLYDIKKRAKTDIEKGSLPKIEDVIENKTKSIVSNIEGVQLDEKEKIYFELTDKLLENKSSREIIASLLKLEYEEELNFDKYTKINEYRSRNEGSVNKTGKARIFIAKGKKDGYTTGKMKSFIAKESKVKESLIRDISVQENFSFITVPFKEAEIIVHAFRNVKQGRRKVVEIAKGARKKRS